MKKYIHDLTKQLELLSVSHQRAFAVAIASRLLPLYLAEEGYDWCRPDLANSAISRMIDCTIDKISMSKEEFDSLEGQLLDASPDMDECGEFDALDACSALGFALKACLPATSSDTPAEFSACVAEVALDHGAASTEYAQDAPEFWRDPAIAREVSAQRAVLEYLKRVSIIDDGAMADVVRLAKE